MFTVKFRNVFIAQAKRVGCGALAASIIAWRSNAILPSADSDEKPAANPINDRPVFGTEDRSPGQQLWHQIPRDERGNFDAGKEKADHETFTANAAACSKRNQLA